MTSVRELYEDSIRYGESTLAHSLLYLIQQGLIGLSDDVSKIDFSKIDAEEVKRMVQENKLGFSNTKIYSLKYDNKRFVFIFANSKEEAINHFVSELNKKPLNCIEYQLDFPILRGKGIVSFREILKEYDKTPAICGYYERSSYYERRSSNNVKKRH